MSISKKQLIDAEQAAYYRGLSTGKTAGSAEVRENIEYLKRSGALALLDTITKLADANAQLTTAATHLVDNLGLRL